jgi:hypothetical protein
MAWYEIHAADFRRGICASAPRRRGALVAQWGATGSYIVKRVVHTEFDKNGDRPRTLLFAESAGASVRARPTTGKTARRRTTRANPTRQIADARLELFKTLNRGDG